MVGFLTLGISDARLNIPREIAHYAGGRDDGGRWRCIVRAVFSGEGVWLDVAATGEN